MGVCFSKAKSADECPEQPEYRAIDFAGTVGEVLDNGALRYITSTNTSYTSRCVQTGPLSLASLNQERELLIRLGRHPLPVFTDGDFSFLMTEISLEAISLRAFLTARAARKDTSTGHHDTIVRGLIGVVVAIHDLGEFHGDIRPESLAIGGQGEIIVAAAMHGAPGARAAVEYRAPEYVNGFGEQTLTARKAADLWSLGATIYEVATDVKLGVAISDWKRRDASIISVEMSTESIIRFALWDMWLMRQVDTIDLIGLPESAGRFGGLLRGLLCVQPRDRVLNHVLNG